jgi:hypothetical protein
LKYLKQAEGKCEVDLTPCVNDFENIIKDWLGKTDGMILPIIKPIKRYKLIKFDFRFII